MLKPRTQRWVVGWAGAKTLGSHRPHAEKRASTASRPSALMRMRALGERAPETGRPRTSGESSALVSVCKSARERPHHGSAEQTEPRGAIVRIEDGAREDERVDDLRGDLRSASRSTARKGMAAWRNAAAMGTSDLRALASTATRYLCLRPRWQPRSAAGERGRSRRFHRFAVAGRLRAVRLFPSLRSGSALRGDSGMNEQ